LDYFYFWALKGRIRLRVVLLVETCLDAFRVACWPSRGACGRPTQLRFERGLPPVRWWRETVCVSLLSSCLFILAALASVVSGICAVPSEARYAARRDVSMARVIVVERRGCGTVSVVAPRGSCEPRRHQSRVQVAGDLVECWNIRCQFRHSRWGCGRGRHMTLVARIGEEGSARRGAEKSLSAPARRR